MKKLFATIALAALAASCTMAPAFAAKPPTPWCEHLGNVAGFAADLKAAGLPTAPAQQAMEKNATDAGFTFEQVEAMKGAFKFGLGMSGKDSPRNIAKYQYYGCLATL